MASKFSIAHEISESRWGRRLRPRSVNEYSTFGGTAGYNFLAIRPSSVSVLSVAVSIFWETSGMQRYMSLNHSVPCCSRVFRTNIAHLSPMRASMLRMGHLGKVASWIVFLSIICVFLCKSSINSRRIGRFWKETTGNNQNLYYYFIVFNISSQKTWRIDHRLNALVRIVIFSCVRWHLICSVQTPGLRPGGLAALGTRGRDPRSGRAWSFRV